MVYISLSLAAKYTERIAFRFSEFLHPLRFHTEMKELEQILTPTVLRNLEFDVLQRLDFKVGDSHLSIDQQYSQIGDSHVKGANALFT